MVEFTFLENDKLNKFVCDTCNYEMTTFRSEVSQCDKCNSPKVRVLNMVSTFSKTGEVFDSIGSIEEDCKKYTEQEELDRDLVKTEKLRRGVDVEC